MDQTVLIPTLPYYDHDLGHLHLTVQHKRQTKTLYEIRS